jgi:hypothetical protein
MKMRQAGTTPAQIRREIDGKYGRIGKPMPVPKP